MNLKPGQKLAFLCIGKSVKLIVQPRYEDLFGIGKGGDRSGYRDRDTRREDILPTVKVLPTAALRRQPAVRKAVRKSKGKLAA